MSYWATAATLVLFGFVTGFSIGPPFLVVGLALFALGPLRRRPGAFRPALGAVVAFNVAFRLVSPISCTATDALDQASQVVCSGPLVTYRGTDSFDPPRESALAAGLVSSVVVAAAVYLYGGWRASRRVSAGGP